MRTVDCLSIGASATLRLAGEAHRSRQNAGARLQCIFDAIARAFVAPEGARALPEPLLLLEIVPADRFEDVVGNVLGTADADIEVRRAAVILERHKVWQPL